MPAPLRGPAPWMMRQGPDSHLQRRPGGNRAILEVPRSPIDRQSHRRRRVHGSWPTSSPYRTADDNQPGKTTEADPDLREVQRVDRTIDICWSVLLGHSHPSLISSRDDINDSHPVKVGTTAGASATGSAGSTAGSTGNGNAVSVSPQSAW